MKQNIYFHRPYVTQTVYVICIIGFYNRKTNYCNKLINDDMKKMT